MKKVLWALCALVAVSSASASVIIVTAPTVTMNGPADYTWSYDVYLAPNSRLTPQGTPCTAVVQGGICDGLLTIFDFDGYIANSASTTAANWTMGTAQLLGITPLGITPSDDPGLLNLSWTYFGNSSVTATPTTALFLGTFSARSLYANPAIDDYASRTSNALGQRSASLDVTTVPTQTPEPGSIALFGSALLALGYVARRKRR